MINTGKKDVLYGYIGYFLKIASNIIVLPLILRYLSPEEYGLWCVFLSIGALVNLADMGFNTVIIRNITYAFCGADKLNKIGKPVIDNIKTNNFKLLFQIYTVSKKIYFRISLITIFVVMVMGLYIYNISKDTVNINTSIIAWIIYGISICMALYFMPYTCIYKGIGKIREIQIIQIKNQLIYIICQILLVSLGGGIIALAFSNLLVNILLRYQMSGFWNKLIQEYRYDYNIVRKDGKEELEEIYKIISYNSKGMGAIMISSFLQSQGMILISSYFLNLNTVGSLGLINQLIGVITSLANVPFTTYMAKMSEYQMKNDDEKLKNLFSFVSIFLHITYLLGGLFIIVFGSITMNLINSNTEMLPNLQICFFIIYNWILSNHQRCTGFIAIGNNQPFVFSYIISSFASVIAAAIALYFTHNILGLIIPNLLIQCLYNGWKWPIEVYRKLGLNFVSMLSRTIIQINRMKLFN